MRLLEYNEELERVLKGEFQDIHLQCLMLLLFFFVFCSSFTPRFKKVDIEIYLLSFSWCIQNALNETFCKKVINPSTFLNLEMNE